MVKYDRHYTLDAAACGAPFPDVVRFFEALPPGPLQILDAGCGQGRDALVAARLGHIVTGFDASSVGVAQLRQQALVEGLRIKIEVDTLEAFQPRTSFDVVLVDRTYHCVSPIALRKSLLAKLAAAVLPGGFLFVVEPPASAAELLASLDLKNVWWRISLPKPGFLLLQRMAA